MDCGPLCRDSQDIPLNRLVELLQVDAELHDVRLVVLLLGVLLPDLVHVRHHGVLVPQVNLKIDKLLFIFTI